MTPSITQVEILWTVGSKPSIPRVARIRSRTLSSCMASTSSVAYCMWKTHSSEAGPQRSGPIGTRTPLAHDPPKSGLTSQRMRTSSSAAQRDRSALMCTETIFMMSRGPLIPIPSMGPTARPPSAPTR